jgi:hypothetical protein
LRKVVLEAKSEEDLVALSRSLDEKEIDHKLWVRTDSFCAGPVAVAAVNTDASTCADGATREHRDMPGDEADAPQPHFWALPCI